MRGYKLTGRDEPSFSSISMISPKQAVFSKWVPRPGRTNWRVEEESKSSIMRIYIGYSLCARPILHSRYLKIKCKWHMRWGAGCLWRRTMKLLNIRITRIPRWKTILGKELASRSGLKYKNMGDIAQEGQFSIWWLWWIQLSHFRPR